MYTYIIVNGGKKVYCFTYNIRTKWFDKEKGTGTTTYISIDRKERKYNANRPS